MRVNGAFRDLLRRRSHFIPLVATILLGVGTSVMALRSVRTRREVERRAIEGFANLAAWNYGFRAHAAVEAAGGGLLPVVGPIEQALQTLDARHLTSAIDSLARCDCAAFVRAHAFAVARWAEPSTLRVIDDSGRALPDRDPRVRALRAIAAAQPKAVRFLSVASGTEGPRPWLLAIYAIRSGRGVSDGLFAVDVDLADLRRRVLDEIFNSGGMLLPVDLTDVTRNAALVSLTMSTNNGVELFTSDSVFHTGIKSTAFAARDTMIRVSAELSPATLAGLTKHALPPPSVWGDALLPVLALLLLGAVVLTTYRAQRLATLRSEFAASVTHELRTPLTQILLNAETLALNRVRGEPERQRVLDGVVREARRLVYLIENVLHFSRADRRLLQMRPRPTRVDLVASELVDSLQVLADAAGSTLELRAPDAITAMADPDGIQLALTNLIDNALHYAAGGAIAVSVEATPSDVVLQVDDHGPGIPARDRLRVQRPFQRLAGTQNGHPTGSGIGLAVVREVMASMHGSLELDDAPLGGLRARLRLPLAPAQAAADI